MEKANYSHDSGKNYESYKKPAQWRGVGYAALDAMGIVVAVENSEGDIVVPDDIEGGDNG
jgi:hypothetical protein